MCENRMQWFEVRVKQKHGYIISNLESLIPPENLSLSDIRDRDEERRNDFRLTSEIRDWISH